VIERGEGRGDAHVYRMPSTGAMVSSFPSVTGSSGVHTTDDRVSPLPTTRPSERATADAPGSFVREVIPRLAPPARVPSKRCGWGSCEDLVCPHEVNFCAMHACCQGCAALQPSVGGTHGPPTAGPDTRSDPIPDPPERGATPEVAR